MPQSNLKTDDKCAKSATDDSGSEEVRAKWGSEIRRQQRASVLIGTPETSVRRVRDSRYLAVHLSPGIWAYLNLAEAVELRAQLDAEIARLSEGFA